MGRLGEALLEVVVGGARVLREHGERRVVAEGEERLLARVGHIRHLVRAGGKVRVRVRGRVRLRRRAGVGQPAACMSRSSSDQPKAVICCTVELPSSPAASALKSPGAIWILCSRSHSP